MAAKRKTPLRSCIGCGEQRDKKEMIRVLRTPEGTFTIDATGRKNGRGAYICRKKECLERAVKNHGLERSFKAPIPAEVYETLRKEMDHLGADT